MIECSVDSRVSHCFYRSGGKSRGVLYFLHQLVPKDYPRLNLKKGAAMCKVLADSTEELIRWGNRNGLRRIHFSRSGKPHYDLWGPWLGLCPSGEEMRRQRDLYRTNLIRAGRNLRVQFKKRNAGRDKWEGFP
jgi:hypothetical protein